MGKLLELAEEAVQRHLAPEGYIDWQIGDVHHLKLTDYHHGEDVTFDSFEWDFLERITSPDIDCVIQEEFWQHYGKAVLTVYISPDDERNRWGDEDADLLRLSAWA